jgi:hypothetical protein
VECLLKLALHRLGSKYSSEIQRGSPSWWKCAWLLTLLGTAFRERTLQNQYERSTERLIGNTGAIPDEKETPLVRATTHYKFGDEGEIDVVETLEHVSDSEEPSSPSAPRRKVCKVDAWLKRAQSSKRPIYIAPMDQLVIETPNLFDPDFAEQPVVNDEATSDLPGGQVSRAPCSSCKEQRSPSGWGTPSCPLCSGLEDLVLPMDHHLFAPLLRTTEVHLEDRQDVKSADRGSDNSHDWEN